MQSLGAAQEFVITIVVAVADQVDVNVRVDEPRHQRAAANVDPGSVVGNAHAGLAARSNDATVIDDNHRVVNRFRLVAVQQHAADKGNRSVRSQ